MPDPRPIRADTVDARFFDLLDLNAPGMETVRERVDGQQYADALNAWRDAVVHRLRANPVGKYNWHGNKLNGKYAAKIEILLGRKQDQDHPQDTANIVGPPGQNRAINWLDPNTNFFSFYPGSRTMDSMVAHYQQSRDPVLIAKWFEIVNDFCIHQKKMEETLPLEQRTGKLSYPRSRNSDGVRIQWYLKSHQITLDAAGRTHSFLKSLAYFAKALPDGQAARDWHKDSMNPIATTLEPGSTDLIPADALANIAISLYQDHTPFLLDAYEKVGRTPNQRFSGLTGLAMLARAFPEFHAGKQFSQIAGAALEDYVLTTVLPDGGDMEQSFNYNMGFNREVRSILELYPEADARPQWVHALHDAMLRRERLFAGVTSPLGSLPRIGTYGGNVPAAVWQSDALLARQKKNVFKDEATAAEDPVARRIYDHLMGPGELQAPDSTSMAFPYSGYYAMRDGWEMTSRYLWLIGARKGSGHKKENINGIAVTAHGRNLLVDAGPPPYTPTHLPEDLRDEFDEIKAYLGESSSRASNTILVDMQNQRRGRTAGPREAYQDPIPARWHNSASFDVAESFYWDGYGGGAWRSEAPIKVAHHRQVVFLRKQGIWLVTDRMTGDGKPHTYQQQWHFPPPHEQWGTTSPGFIDEQVVIDERRRLVRTTDPAGPNIALHQFSPTQLAYKRYFGQKEPCWLGWYAKGIGGAPIPAVDVHTCWESDGDTIITTALVPSPGEHGSVLSTNDLSQPGEGISGGRLQLANDTMITWLAATNQTELRIGDLSAKAETLLMVNTPGQPPKGIALGVQSITLASNAAETPSADFEYLIQDGKLRATATIHTPESPKN